MSSNPEDNLAPPPVAGIDDNVTLMPAQQDLQARVAELEKALTEVEARANANMYNFQKRIEREADLSKKYAIEKFAKGVLDVVDNLERAIAAATDETPQAMLDGIQLTLKNLLATLEKNGISVIDPAGAAFNADLHQAVGIAPDTAKDVVGQVLQKGYALQERVLRPAMVTVGA